jgi:hypothetical protein
VTKKTIFSEDDIRAYELSVKQEEARKALGDKWIAASNSRFRGWNIPDPLYEIEYEIETPTVR